MSFDLSTVLSKLKIPGDCCNGGHIRVCDLTRNLRLQDTGIDNSANMKLQNYPNTNFPRNTPCYICGPKGSGKTYLIAGLMQYVMQNRYANRVFYVYAENVDTTITRAVDKNILFNIPKDLCRIVLMKFLRKKTKFLCCSRFAASYNALGIAADGDVDTIEIVNSTNVYWDNLLAELVKLKNLKTISEFVGYCTRVVEKYANNDTILVVGSIGTGQTFNYNVGKFTVDDYDVIIMDDIAQFGDCWGRNRVSMDGLYKYFTITRQNQTTFYLAGQALKQLPKMLREQLGALVVLFGTDLEDLVGSSAGFRIPKRLLADIREKFITFKVHDGFLFNYNTNVLEYFKN